MTQEDKDLLLRDISDRLMYGLKGHYKYYDFIGGIERLVDENDGDITGIDIKLENPIKVNGHYTEIEYVKPYLRPMYSMTEEENKEYAKVIVKSQDCSFENNESAATMVNDWYLSKGFDVRGLIPKGLALEAPEGMYK